MTDPVIGDLIDLRDVIARIRRLERIEKAARELIAAEDEWNRAHGAVEATKALKRKVCAMNALATALEAP